MSVHVLRPGLLTTVQDAGRFGFASLGIGRAGAMDDVALRLANALVGNTAQAAGLEITLLGPRLRFDEDAVIALTGADIEANVDGQPVPAWRPVALCAGSELDLGRMPGGARSYLAVAGGINTLPGLGSRSVDLHGGIGGRVLHTGDSFDIANRTREASRFLDRHIKSGSDTVQAQLRVSTAHWSLDPQPWTDTRERPIRVVTGSHFAHLDDASKRTLFNAPFRIGKDSNRVGYRLQGTALAVREPLELISEGVVPGTVQLPPGGDPIVLMAEAPTCGGYPRIAQVIALDRPRLAQRRPGDVVRFEQIGLQQAQSGYLEREQALVRLEHNIRSRLLEEQ